MLLGEKFPQMYARESYKTKATMSRNILFTLLIITLFRSYQPKEAIFAH